MVRPSTGVHLQAFAAITMFAITLSSCSRREEIATYEDSASKPANSANASAFSTDPYRPLSHASPDGTQSVSAASPLLKYTTPDGWSVMPASSMLKASFRIIDGEQGAQLKVIDVSLAAGELLPNVNRWRQQIKLGDVTEEELAATVSTIQVGGETGQYVELVGPKDAELQLAILGVIVLRADRYWFFKMFGNADLVEHEKGRFEEFLQSVQFAGDGDGNG